MCECVRDHHRICIACKCQCIRCSCSKHTEMKRNAGDASVVVKIDFLRKGHEMLCPVLFIAAVPMTLARPWRCVMHSQMEKNDQNDDKRWNNSAHAKTVKIDSQQRVMVNTYSAPPKVNVERFTCFAHETPAHTFLCVFLFRTPFTRAEHTSPLHDRPAIEFG